MINQKVIDRNESKPTLPSLFCSCEASSDPQSQRRWNCGHRLSLSLAAWAVCILMRCSGMKLSVRASCDRVCLKMLPLLPRSPGVTTYFKETIQKKCPGLGQTNCSCGCTSDNHSTSLQNYCCSAHFQPQEGSVVPKEELSLAFTVFPNWFLSTFIL